MDELVRLLNALLMLAAPLALGVFLARRLRVGWRLFLVGAATFVGSQVLHIPFNAWVLAPALQAGGLTSSAPAGLPLLVLGLAYGLSAGVFEEGARALAYRFWIKDARRWRDGVMYGAGHGGAEAIILGGLGVYAFFQLVALRDADLAGVVPPEYLELARAQIAAYWGAPWYEALAGAVERILALCVQTSLAVLVLQAFVRRNPLWVVGAIVWHAVIDALAVVTSVLGWPVYAIEGVVAVGALLSVVAIFALKPKHEEPPADVVGPRPPPAPPSGPGKSLREASLERLDETRYTG
jgi:uncharacterized membrane protein YhfC